LKTIVLAEDAHLSIDLRDTTFSARAGHAHPLPKWHHSACQL